MKLLYAMLSVIVMAIMQDNEVQIRVTTADQIASSSMDAVLVEEALIRAKSAPLQKPSDAVVSAALDADERHMKSIFQEQWGLLAGVSTKEYGKEDILLAKWSGSPGDPAVRSVVLWDAPQFNMTIVQCDPTVLVSADGVRSFLGRFLKFTGSPLGEVSVDFRILGKPSVPGIVGVGWVNYTRSPERALPGYEFELSAYHLGRDAYFVFRTGKKLIGGVYSSDMVFISERFPPLRERIRQFDKKELVARLGATPEQDAILIRALLERGLSEDEFQLLLSGRGLPPQERPKRVFLVIRSVAESGQTTSYESFIRNSFQWLESMGPDGAPLLGALVTGLRGVQEVDFSTATIDLLRKGLAYKEALSYLEFRGHTQEVLDFLTNLRLPGQLEEQRQRAVQAVSLRMGAPPATR